MWKSFALCGHCFVDDSVFAGKVGVTEASYIVRADGQRAIFGTHTTFRLCRYSLEAAIIPCSPWTFRITITDIDCLPCWVQSRFQQTVVEKHPARRRELLRVASCVTPAIPFSANGQGIGIFGDFRHKTGKMWISEHILPVMGVLRQPDFLCWFEPGFDLSFLDPKAPPDVSGPPRDAEVLSSTDAWCAKLLIHKLIRQKHPRSGRENFIIHPSLRWIGIQDAPQTHLCIVQVHSIDEPKFGNMGMSWIGWRWNSLSNRWCDMIIGWSHDMRIASVNHRNVARIHSSDFFFVQYLHCHWYIMYNMHIFIRCNMYIIMICSFL